MKLDPREQPSYTIPEAARYLSIPASAIRHWSADGHSSPPLIVLPPRSEKRPALLSFFNLVELHVLAAIRRRHAVSMPKVREAVNSLKREFELSMEDKRHPLLSHAMAADGLDLFVEKYGALININRGGQIILKGMLNAALQRIDRDDRKIPVRLYPFTHSKTESAPALIAIESGLSAGRPVINGTGLAAEIIAERYKAGESIRELANDYGVSRKEVEEAVRCQMPAAA